MKKSFMNNIKNFVDSNVRQRIDRVANNNNDFFGDDLLSLENQFEDIRCICIEAEKKITALLQSLNSPSSLSAYTQNVQTSLNSFSATSSNSPNPASSLDVQSHRAKIDRNEDLLLPAGNDRARKPKSETDATELRGDIRRHKKLPVVGFLKFLNKSRYKTKHDSLLGTTLSHCYQTQTQMTQLYLDYEQKVESQCLLPLRQILEIDVPNIVKSRKLFIKSHNDLESIKAKYYGANQRQQQTQTSQSTGNSYSFAQTTLQQVTKLDQLKREMDEAEYKYEQAKDAYAAELYAFVCQEIELVNLLMRFYQYQAEYHQQIASILQGSLPSINHVLANSARKVVFGTSLSENLRCTGRNISLVVEVCIHILCSNALTEEGLFRIPGSATKIKKLKNAINAWFVSLACYNDLKIDDRVCNGNNATTLAIYELFKDIVGVKSRPDTSSSEVATSPRESITKQDEHSLIFDVHAIAGLLKLYLRELPEPLFTHEYHQQWIAATLELMNRNDMGSIKRVIQDIPRQNYYNLSYLIRFLHLLTMHSKQNKMTATNLAITMAPSLIWTRAVTSTDLTYEQQSMNDQDPIESHLDEMQALNVQMSNVGISASLHALVVENLISHAEELFPDQIQFTISDLDLIAKSTLKSTLRQERFVKSTSPTGNSTASSSSFSSTSISSFTGAAKHSRKGGSMDGMLGVNKLSHCAKTGSGSTSIHTSVEVIQPVQTQRHSLQPPPVPPAPATRSHQKQTSDNICSNKQIAPSQSTLKRQQPVDKRTETSSEKPFERLSTKRREAATSSNHGTQDPQSRITPSPTAIAKIKSSDRPNVPPPCRPKREGSETTQNQSLMQVIDANRTKSDASLEIRNPPSHSSSELLRADYEEINTGDIDDLSITSTSNHVVSLDSISNDSSFDQESANSLENSWAECDIEQQPSSSGAQNDNSQSISTEVKSIKPKHHGSKTNNQVETINSEQTSDSSKIGELSVPPVKPPRCLSPRVTQSTPL